MENLNGTWLKIKTGGDYCRPELLNSVTTESSTLNLN